MSKISIHPVLGFGAGLVFGLGLVISGMSNPAKVLNFLDVLGTWDPSLIFVLGGASITAFLGFQLVGRREKPLAMPAFELPTRSDIDARLIVGSGLFGLGWGISGFCPGPAWTALPLAEPGVLIFLPSMFVGMWAASYFSRLSIQKRSTDDSTAQN